MDERTYEMGDLPPKDKIQTFLESLNHKEFQTSSGGKLITELQEEDPEEETVTLSFLESEGQPREVASVQFAVESENSALEIFFLELQKLEEPDSRLLREVLALIEKNFPPGLKLRASFISENIKRQTEILRLAEAKGSQEQENAKKLFLNHPLTRQAISNGFNKFEVIFEAIEPEDPKAFSFRILAEKDPNLQEPQVKL